jgi:hypothetical protein
LFRFILCLITFLVFTPLGVWTLGMAFSVTNPHVFVMVIFSGSLMALLGLTGLAGAWFGRPGKEEEDDGDGSEI